MRPPHMSQYISLMSFDSPPLFLVSEDILRDFQCFSVVKESPVFLFKVSTVFMFIHLLILSDSLSVID